MNRIGELFQRWLTSRIAPMVYVMMLVSVVIGFAFLTGITVDANESILYGTGVLIDPQLWGGILFVTASTAFVGMLTKRESLISFGGLAGATVWLFATVSVILAGHWYILMTVAAFHFIFHVYVFLASSNGTLYRSGFGLDKSRRTW